MSWIGVEVASDNLAQKQGSKTPVATRAATPCASPGKFVTWIIHHSTWSQWSANTELAMRALIRFVHHGCFLQCFTSAVLSQSWREEIQELCVLGEGHADVFTICGAAPGRRTEETVELSEPGYQNPFPFNLSLSLLSLYPSFWFFHLTETGIWREIRRFSFRLLRKKSKGKNPWCFHEGIWQWWIKRNF